MKAELKGIKVLEVLKANEEAVERLYGMYGVKFPELKEFWEGLSGEEAEHAECLGLLKQKVEEGSVHIKAGRFNETAIQTSVDYVSRLLEEVDEPETDLVKALSLAEYIEESMLENKYFEVFEDDGSEIRRTLVLLSEAIEDHLARVRAELAKAEGREV